MLKRRLVLLATVVSGAAPVVAGAAKHPKPAPSPVVAGSPADTPLGPIDTAARWAFVTDFNTGAVLLNKNADEAMPPSSMTKLMTAYIVYGMLKAGRLRLDQELPVSEKAWRMQGSKMFVPLNEPVKVEDLIRGMIVQSGNDACIVLAEGIAGSEDAFVELMNQKSNEMGLRNTHFANCTGWPDPEQHVSCRDLATIAKRLIADFPEYYRFDSEKSFTFNNITQENRNPLVQKGLADGLKTGHTDAGGYGLVASAQRGGRRVILVMNGLTSMHQRAEESERMMEWSFREFQDVTLFTAGDTVEDAKVWLGTAPTVPLVGGRDLIMTMPREWQRNARISVEYQSPISAPVSRGDVLGKLTVSGKGVPSLEMPLLAGSDVARLGLPGRAIAVVSRYVTGS